MPYNDSFGRSIQINLSYWQNFIERHHDFRTLEQERSRILRAISFGLDLRQAWQVTYALIIAYSPYIEKRGLSDQWSALLAQAVDSAQQCQDQSAEVTLRLIRARLLRKQGDFFKAMQVYRKIIQLCRSLADAFNEARAYTNLGYLYIEHGQWRRAEILCLHALHLFDQIENNYGRAHTQNHLGLLYTRLHKWQEAEQYLAQACETWRTMGDQQGLLLGQINLGLLHNEMDSPHAALLNLHQALTLAQQLGDEAQIASIYINMGVAYRLLGMATEAASYAQQAETLYRRFANLVGMGLAWDNLGLAYFDQNQLPTAKHYLEKALETWRQLQNQHGEIRTALYLLECEIVEEKLLNAATRFAQLEERNEEHNWLQRYPDLTEIFARCRQRLHGETTSDASADSLNSN